jgi:hypothetical protein
MHSVVLEQAIADATTEAMSSKSLIAFNTIRTRRRLL